MRPFYIGTFGGLRLRMGVFQAHVQWSRFLQILESRGI